MLIRNSESQHAFILWNDAFRLYLAKSGKYPQIQGNIATMKLIQCEIAEMPENKAFCEFCGFIFFAFLSLFSVAGAVPFFDFAPLFNDSRNR